MTFHQMVNQQSNAQTVDQHANWVVDGFVKLMLKSSTKRTLVRRVSIKGDTDKMLCFRLFYSISSAAGGVYIIELLLL